MTLQPPWQPKQCHALLLRTADLPISLLEQILLLKVSSIRSDEQSELGSQFQGIGPLKAKLPLAYSRLTHLDT